MCKRSICLIFVFVVLALVNSSSAEVLVHWTFDEGSGTTVFDASGNGRYGTFVGSPQWVAGKYGVALEFNGTSDYVIHNMPAAQSFDTFTVAFWVKASSVGQGQWMAPFSSHTPNSSGIQIDVDGTDPGNYRTNPPGGTTSAQFGPVTLEWVHLALVGRGTDVEYYYNGALSTTQTFTSGDLLFNEFLVGNSRNNSNYFAGAVDDFQVLDEALSADDIEKLMNLGAGGIPLARRPSPADKALYEQAWASLTWKAGDWAVSHDLYFGTAFDDVNDGAEGTAGDIWSLTTMPDIAVTDPNLVVLWTLDEGPGSQTVVDWSGHGHHGTLNYGPQWTDGVFGEALQFDGADDFVIHQLSQAQNFDNFTVALWARADSLGQGQFMSPFSSHSPNSSGIQMDVDGTNPGYYRTNPPGGTTSARFGPVTLDWVHLALVGSGTTVQYYYNGTLSTTETLTTNNLLFNEFLLANSRNNSNFFGGTIDDFRVYDKALTEAEIQLVMRSDPLLAWEPSPAKGSTPDIDAATPLTWSPGDSASGHEVYFGTDKDAVSSTDTSDTTGVYRGSQSGTSYTPAEGVEWGGGPYYWRIDENNTDGTVTKGGVWNFAVADFLLVDDFESYTDNDVDNEAIWQNWVDGFGIATNGSQVGYFLPPYAERTIINRGAQSMPLAYDNRAGVRNSEAELTLTAGRDWARHGVEVLSLWFRGYPASVGSFTEGPVGTFTMTGSGADIAGPSDEFHYAYKVLTGAGTIVAKIDSVESTHAWAKAGVMIRETLDPNSAHAMAFVTPGQGVVLEYRLAAGLDNVGAAAQETGITAAHWVKLERDATGNFAASHSTNGSSWTSVQSSIPQNISMTSSVYIGLALTSHDALATCEAKFSNVSITGTVGPQWMHQDVGIPANAAEPLYMALSNSNGTSAVVVNGDVNASITDVWTEWLIDLSEFANQGVNLSNVDKIAIGLGSKGDANAAGGSGTMFIDDITLRKPAPEPQP